MWWKQGLCSDSSSSPGPKIDMKLSKSVKFLFLPMITQTSSGRHFAVNV